MYIGVIGTGYVGLVAGACFAETGNDVICADIDDTKIDMLNRGKVPIYEPGLEEMINRNAEEGRLAFSNNIPMAGRRSKVIFIAVGTPPGDDGSADLSHVYDVAANVGRNMNGYKVIVTKSTVPVGTTEAVRRAVQKETGDRFDVASNPEFLKEGAAIEDFLKPDRIVIGSDSEEAISIMQELYAPFVRTENPILVMDIHSAEMTKYASNAMLATKISFINEMACICEKVGADIDNVRRGMGFDSRIGFKFLFPGVGYGGSCFPKDVKALISTSQDAGFSPHILEAVENVNEKQKHLLADKVIEHFGEDLSGVKVAIWGLSFKPRTDDMRDAPSLIIINRLLEKGAQIVAFDPEATENAQNIIGDKISYADSLYDAVKDVDALLIATEWNEFRRPNFERMVELMKKPVVFDGRNIYDPQKMLKRGFVYFGIGRKNLNG